MSTRRKNRWIAVGIVASVVLAACIGNLTLSSSEQQLLTSNGPIMMGPVSIGSSVVSPPIVVSFTNPVDSDRIMTITAPNCGSQWSLQLGQPLPVNIYCPGGSGSSSTQQCQYQFAMRFTPTVNGVQACQVVVAYETMAVMGSGGGTNDTQRLGVMNELGITITARGQAPDYDFVITPPSLPFNDVPNTSTATQQVQVRNSGNQPISLTAMAPSMPFGIVAVGTTGSLAGEMLAPNQTATYDVTCQMPSAGDHQDAISFSAPQGAGALLTKKLPIQCTGVNANFLMEPSPISFPRNVRVGQAQDIAVQFTNQSGGPVTITDATLEEVNEVTISSSPIGRTLSNNETLSVALHYEAATEQAFGRINRLTITANTVSRTAAINAEALVADIGISPPAVEFGPVCVGAPKSMGIQLYTTASASVQFQAVTQPQPPFTVDGMMGELVGNHGNIIDLTANVTPTAPGELTDTFVINTDVSPREIPISAVALPMGVATTPTEVHFGASKLNALTTGKSVVVSNCQNAEHSVTSAVITGKDADEFTIVSPADPLQKIEIASSLELLVVMRPTSPGNKVAALEVTLDDGSMVSAALDGNGLEGPGEKDTYYTCSTGRAGASLPVGLALLALARRRRTRPRA